MVDIKNLAKSFNDESNGLTVLKNINLKINKGEMTALIGTSGAGKTTLLQIIGGLDSATSGSVSIEGKNVDSMNNRELSEFRGRFIGFVYQFHHLLPDFNALENTMIPGLIVGMSKGNCRKRAMELLDSVGLSGRLTHFPSELSGGERQRIALARALFNNPALVLADEPTGNLDRRNGEMLLELFHKANRDLGQTFLVATHNAALADGMNKTLYLEDGEIQEKPSF